MRKKIQNGDDGESHDSVTISINVFGLHKQGVGGCDIFGGNVETDCCIEATAFKKYT